MKKLLLFGVAAGSIGYYLYNRNKKKERIVPKVNDLSKNQNDYLVYFDEKEKNKGEELFV